MGEVDVMKHGGSESLSIRIAEATGLESAKVEEVVQLALEALHRVTIVDEKGLTAAMMESCFEFGAKAAFHLIGLIISDHDYHGRSDDAGIWCEVLMRFIPTEYAEGCDRIAPWLAERSAARIKLDAYIRDQSTPIANSESDDEHAKSSTAPQGDLFNVPWRQAMEPMAKRYAQEHERFLRDNNPAVLKALRRSGELNSYLSSVGNQAAERFVDAMASLVNSKEYQNLQHQAQLKELQNCRESVEELIRHDMIYQPVRSED